MDVGGRDWLAQARRGVLELCVLQLIGQQPRYGYELTTMLAQFGQVLAASEGTLYPLLRRLQRDGYVEATWQESRDGPPRKYYHLSPAGEQLLQAHLSVWDQISGAVGAIGQLRVNHMDEEVQDGTGSERHSALS